MIEGEADQPVATASDGSGEATAPRAGEQLRAAREAQGLSLAEVGQRTRVPLRHLEAVEQSDYAALPSPTYAVGFARAYARAVGLNDVAVARDVRGELAKVERPPEYVPYETADPDRVPPRGVAIIGAGVALAILILVGLYYGTDLFRPGAPTTVAEAPAATPAPGAFTPPAAAPTPIGPQQVSLSAGEEEVWMRVYDADNTTLYLGTLAPGAKFDVPPTANRPMINVGRPDQLRVTLDGRAVPPLGDGRRAIKDVPVDAAAIAARTGRASAPDAAAVAPAPSPTVAAPTPAPAPAQTAAPERVVRREQPAARRPEPRRAEPRRTEPRRPAARATPAPRPSPTRDGPENLLPSGFGQ